MMKEYLRQIIKTRRQIEWRREQIGLARRGLPSRQMTAGESQGLKRSQIESLLIRIETLAEEINELVRINEKVKATLKEVKDIRERKVLEYRYDWGFEWQEIALLMGTTERTVYKIHAKGLETLASVTKV